MKFFAVINVFAAAAIAQPTGPVNNKAVELAARQCPGFGGATGATGSSGFNPFAGFAGFGLRSEIAKRQCPGFGGATGATGAAGGFNPFAGFGTKSVKTASTEGDEDAE